MDNNFLVFLNGVRPFSKFVRPFFEALSTLLKRGTTLLKLPTSFSDELPNLFCESARGEKGEGGEEKKERKNRIERRHALHKQKHYFPRPTRAHYQGFILQNLLLLVHF